MINLKEETLKVLSLNGKSIDDVQWIGTDKGTIDTQSFLSAADEEYDNGFGAVEVNSNIKIVGNNWWIERFEYDGSEKWVFKKIPVKPTENEAVEVFTEDHGREWNW